MDRLAFVLLVLVSCSGSDSTDRSPPPTPAREPASAPKPDPAKWACTVDADCMNSCKHGAVSTVGYRATNPSECKDGCANQTAETPRCIAAECVAFHRPRGLQTIVRSDECTHQIEPRM